MEEEGQVAIDVVSDVGPVEEARPALVAENGFDGRSTSMRTSRRRSAAVISSWAVAMPRPDDEGFGPEILEVAIGPDSSRDEPWSGHAAVKQMPPRWPRPAKNGEWRSNTVLGVRNSELEEWHVRATCLIGRH